MVSFAVFTSVLFFSLFTLAFASSQQLDVCYWPLQSLAPPKRLFGVNYDAITSEATISSYTPPEGAFGDKDELIRIGTLNPVSKQWTGTLIRRSALGSKQSLALKLHVDPSSSQVYSVSLSAGILPSEPEHNASPKINIIYSSPYLSPDLAQPAPTVQDGFKPDQPPEKTFLQRQVLFNERWCSILIRG
ncbi:hypothetical protein KEM56_004038 [Ascosphaera pollenicola]|nr:hypothetical protein KEM56_004038 [Ascosphaera pollenicola]